MDEESSSTGSPCGSVVDVEHLRIREDLSAALDAIGGTGAFSAFTKLEEASIHPIFVDDVGCVEFPMSEASARTLIEKAHQAPYGKGTETFVDTSVRKTWELDAARLHPWPQWDDLHERACKWVAEVLGIPAGTMMKAELYKMLIYEKGAMFKPHTE